MNELTDQNKQNQKRINTVDKYFCVVKTVIKLKLIFFLTIIDAI